MLPTLAAAQKERDTTEVDRVLAQMAEAARFDLYGNRATVLMFDALKRARGVLPANYLKSDLTRLTKRWELPALRSFLHLAAHQRLSRGDHRRRRESCLALSKTMQRAMPSWRSWWLRHRKAFDAPDSKEAAPSLNAGFIGMARCDGKSIRYSATALAPECTRPFASREKCAPCAEEMSASLYCESIRCRSNLRRITDDRLATTGPRPMPQGGDFLEESAMPYRLVPVNIGTGEQFSRLSSPSHRTTACRPSSITFRWTEDRDFGIRVGRDPVCISHRRASCSSRWTFAAEPSHGMVVWQVRGWADGRPEHHFARYAPEKIPYAIDRYVKETTVCTEY